MCGIAGFYNAKVEQIQINDLMTKLHHRGPDDQRFYSHQDVGLIHTRLSIIELSELGAQPYRFENLVLVFNGELYNYKEVREELKQRSYSFQSNSDTEVLLKAFHCWREQCVSHFIGMFAFAIYDEAEDSIWLFRDRLGVKPLYYGLENGKLIFASELHALSVLGHSREINLDAVSTYFRFGFTPGSQSIFKPISKLKAGSYIKVNRSGAVKKKYWQPSDEINHSKTETQWVDEIEDLMISAFRYRMVSDVPVGVFLSGGIDSSLLTAILQKHYGSIHSFTIGFEETGFDESSYARQVANHLNITHTEKTLKLAEAKKILNQFYTIYDEPFADTSGIPTSCVTQLAKVNGMKVVLSADGGDELFAGYTHYQRVLKLYASVMWLPLKVRKALARSSKTILPKQMRERIFTFNLEHKTYAVEELLLSETPTQFFEALVANQTYDEIENLIHYVCEELKSSTTNQHPLQHMMMWDLNNYLADDLLVKVDRATMFHGIECREPLLDHRLVELSMQIPVDLRIKDGKGKYLARQILKRYVPESFFERKKQGFSIPIFNWFNQELDAMFKIYLSAEKLKQVPFIDATEVEKEYKKYLLYKARGKEYNIEKMWRLLSFMLWWEKYMQV